jgi:GxxExxY protein
MAPRESSAEIKTLVDIVLGVFFEVYNELGYGLSERLYCVALGIVLESRGLLVAKEVTIPVMFRGRQLGYCRADLLIEDAIILQIKTGSALPPGSKDQLSNYVRRSNANDGLLLFFGPSPSFKRVYA